MSGGAHARRSAPRRTQQERSANTRERLLDAALACLVEHGYAHTTTTLVAERAGLSRGAQLHHFPTKAELLAATAEHLFRRRLAEFERRVAELPAGPDPVAAGLGVMWSVFSDPTATAMLELLVAARTDAELRAKLAPVAARLDALLEQSTAALFPARVVRDPRFVALRAVTVLALQGLAVAKVVQPRSEEQGVLDFLAALSRETLASIAGGGEA